MAASYDEMKNMIMAKLADETLEPEQRDSLALMLGSIAMLEHDDPKVRTYAAAVIKIFGRLLGIPIRLQAVRRDTMEPIHATPVPVPIGKNGKKKVTIKKKKPSRSKKKASKGRGRGSKKGKK